MPIYLLKAWMKQHPGCLWLSIGRIRVLFIAQLQILVDIFQQSQYWFYYSYSVYCVSCDGNNLTSGCLKALQVYHWFLYIFYTLFPNTAVVIWLLISELVGVWQCLQTVGIMSRTRYLTLCWYQHLIYLFLHWNQWGDNTCDALLFWWV